MKPVTKQDWIDALRSGEFKQCTGALGKRDPETGTTSYCCLGVLATIAGVGVQIEPLGVYVEDAMLFTFDDDNEECGIIPDPYQSTIVSDLDLSTLVVPDPEHPGGIDDDLMRILSTKNDNGATFEDIATYLEELA